VKKVIEDEYNQYTKSNNTS